MALAVIPRTMQARLRAGPTKGEARRRAAASSHLEASGHVKGPAPLCGLPVGKVREMSPTEEQPRQAGQRKGLGHALLECGLTCERKSELAEEQPRGTTGPCRRCAGSPSGIPAEWARPQTSSPERPIEPRYRLPPTHPGHLKSPCQIPGLSSSG